MRSRGLVIALAALVGTVALAAVVALGPWGDDDGRDGDPTDDGFVAVTTTEPSQNPCRHARRAEVERIAGEASGLDVVEGRCRYSFGDGGEAQVEVRPGGDALELLLPGSAVQPELGDEARWGATPDGGTMAVKVDDEVLLASVVLPDRPADAQSVAFALARLAAGRITDDVGTGEVPGAGPVAPCDLLADEARDEVLGTDWQVETGSDPAACTYRSPAGVQVLVGPLVRPATEAQLASVTRTGSDGEQWPRTAVDVGDVGVLLTDPTEPGIVSLTAIEGVEALRVEVRGGDGEESRRLAAEVAEAVLAARAPT